MSHPTPPPAFVPPSDAQLLPATISMSTEISCEAGKPASKPGRMEQDVWTVLQEYRRSGGLLDIGEEIAGLQAIEHEIRAGDMSARDKANLLLQVTEKRGRLKKTHLDLIRDKRNFLTLDLFAEFVEELYAVLLKHVGDPFVLKKIGFDLTGLTSRIQAKMDSK